MKHIDTPYIRFNYKVIQKRKYAIIYKLVDKTSECFNKLSDDIRISVSKNNINSGIAIKTLSVKEKQTWRKIKKITDLTSTEIKNFYSGVHIDRSGKKSLLIIYYHPQRRSLFIDYYNCYYPYEEQTLNQVINLYRTEFL